MQVITYTTREDFNKASTGKYIAHTATTFSFRILDELNECTEVHLYSDVNLNPHLFEK
jgi:hypothetical protein